MDRVDFRAFLAGYLAEVDELVAAATARLVELEAALRRGEPNLRALRELFRAAHTLKGLSAMMGVEPVVAVTHALEAALLEAEKEPARLSVADIDVLAKAVQAVQHRVRELAGERPVSPPPADLLGALEALGSGGRAPAAGAAPALLHLPPDLAAKLTPAEQHDLARGVATGRRAVAVEFVPSPERAGRGTTITTVRERVGAIAEIVRVFPVAAPATPEMPGGLVFTIVAVTDAPEAALADAAECGPERVRRLAPAAPAAARAAREIESSVPVEDLVRERSVRVDVGRLDDTMGRLATVVVTRFRLERAAAGLAAGPAARELQGVLREHARQLRDLRAAIVSLRLVRLTDVLEKLPLLVSGLRRATGKAVRLELDAGRAEVDKAVADRVFPAIVHLLRNAVDHGIEAPEERRRLGKPDEGLVAVQCAERGSNRLEIIVADDGRGIDRAALARRLGRPVPTGEGALLDLLCTAGASTREAATATSGRGLGMEIVRRIVVDELGGELHVATTPGGGTTFTAAIPLTVSILDAFSCECAGVRFAVPVGSVEEILDVDPARVVRVPRGAAPAVAVVERRGEAVPVHDLGSVFGAGDGTRRKALLTRRAGEAHAFLIDRVLGQLEIVIRPLEDPLVRRPGLVGTTDLGDGRPTLVVDLLALRGGSGTAEEAAA